MREVAMIKSVIENVPDYKNFLTLEELDESTKKLAWRFPGIVELFEAGRSGSGHPIYCLKIGNGSKNALAFACPHPNEPIGAMMLDYFSSALAENEELRSELDYTWYIIKCSDPDGVMLNEGWFKGPFTLYNYARNFYRPTFIRQVEWTFPIRYKKLNFSRPIPETRAIMNIIDKIKPTFMYSLHNSGFGGVYWYMTEEMPDIYDNLRESAQKQKVPLNLGEPEVPYAKRFSPAIYKMIDSKDMYDYYEQYTKVNPEEIITFGTSSADYANSKGKTFTLLSELPYFYDQRINDTSESDLLRRDAIIKNCEYFKETALFIKKNLEETMGYISTENPFRQFLMDNIPIGLQEVDAKSSWAATNPELLKKATVAEKFDNLYVSRFYNLLNLGSLVRLYEYELPNRKGEIFEVLKKAFDTAEKELKRSSGLLESELDYHVIPIQRLVRIQLESGLITAKALVGKKSN